MALDLGKLEAGLIDAFEKGQETDPPEGTEGAEEFTPKYSDADVAGFIADAIVDYASDAEVTVYIPLLFTTPPVPPVGIMGMPDL